MITSFFDLLFEVLTTSWPWGGKGKEKASLLMGLGSILLNISLFVLIGLFVALIGLAFTYLKEYPGGLSQCS